TRDEDLDTGINDYPSYCDDDKKIHIDYAHNLKFSCMIGFEFTHVIFFLLLYINVKNKMVYKGYNVVGALMNVPIFVGTFSVMTNFAVLEDMDAYRDNGMGGALVVESVFCQAYDEISSRITHWSKLLKTNTPYPSRKIRRIRACTHQRPQRNEAQYAISRRCQYVCIEDIVCEYSGRYQTWSLLQETPIRRIQLIGYARIEATFLTL
ncbi:hypothetical protein Tco_0976878, partial [Tanacetum coccineum]